MFRVSCPGCNAPYQVDERKVPELGLQMRCPKCSEQFRVKRPEEPHNPTPSGGAVPGSLPEPTSARDGTIQGVAPSVPGSLISEAKSARDGTIQGVAPSVPGSPISDAKSSRGMLGRTMVGVGPKDKEPKGPGKIAGVGIPRPTIPRPVLTDKDLLDLPARVAPAAELPAVKRAFAPPRPAAVTPHDQDLPAVATSAPRSKVAPTEANLPSVFGDEPAPNPGLPAPFPTAAGLATSGNAFDALMYEDLPAPVAPRTQAGIAPEPAGLPALRGAAPTLAARAGSLPANLPAIAMPPRPELPAKREPAGVGLPERSRLGSAALPATHPEVDDLDGFDVFAAAAEELPALDAPPPAPALMELPDLRGGVVHTLVSEPDVPVRRLVPDLPDLPDLMSGAAGPSRSASAADAGLDFSDSDVPGAPLELEGFEHQSPMADVSSPGRSAALKSVARAVPSGLGIAAKPHAGGVPRDSFDLDDLPPIGPGTSTSGFGELQLPGTGEAQSEPPRSPRRSDSGKRAAATSSPEIDPFGVGEDGALGGDPFGASDAPSSEFAESSAFDDAPGSDPFGDPLSSVAQPSEYDAASDADEFSEEGSPFDEAPKGGGAARTRAPGGGAGYGEVDLGSDADADDSGVRIESGGEADGMEFGGIPEQEGDPDAPPGDDFKEAAPIEDSAASIAAKKDLAKLEEAAEGKSVRRKRLLRVAAGGLFLVLVSGFSLALVPEVGPFGVYWISDRVSRGSHEALLASVVDEAREAIGRDTFPDAEAAIQRGHTAQGQATRFRPLVAYTSFLEYATVLRFGSAAQREARAQVALQELDQVGEPIDKLPLAKAIQSAVRGDLAGARAALTALGDDFDALVTLGEVELLEKKFEPAKAAFTKAIAQQRTARTLYGLARAFSGLKNDDEALKVSTEVLQTSPRHVGARIVVAEILWRTKADEMQPAKLLEEAVASADAASIGERVTASTLLGEIYLARGRVSYAQKAFAAAVQLDPKSSRALLGFGEAMFRSGLYAEALARFKAGSIADDKDRRCAIGSIKSLVELGRLEDAVAEVTVLLQKFPEASDVHHWNGTVQEAKGEREKAIESYRLAIKFGGKEPDSIHSYLAVARLLRQGDELEEAEKVLDTARSELPDSAVLHKALGALAVSQGKYESALEQYQQAVALAPDDLDAKFSIGVTMRRLKRYEEAKKIFDQVALADPDLPGLALERGLLLEESGSSEEALEQYEAALAKAPKDPDLMLRVACSKVAAGKGKDSVSLLQNVLRQRQNSAEANHCLGRALMQKGDASQQEAMRALRKAVDYDPNRAEYHLWVGLMAIEMTSYGEAEKSLERAIELDKGLAEAYWQRGRLHNKQGRQRDAIADIERAIQLKPGRLEFHADLADAYTVDQRYAQAEVEWGKALNAFPNEADWRFRFGKLLFSDLQMAAAIPQLQKALELTKVSTKVYVWIGEAHRMLAQAFGKTPAAKEHWVAFLELGDQDSPFRKEGMKVLEDLGAPYKE